ncbi:DUF1501 domain-containing protein [Brenneria tiliae]|uniref:DUF1501 domain-containing protein n=1 Tax=Brenneria tiliae TaxID=2914984 RepID=A0ABT0MQN5_9GAMM|nr:DUF1501 domain-containing protein [Brenneria tiliae]MCL2892107.1 DUF1501 domain-containing protein [Brenneria tiliae]
MSNSFMPARRRLLCGLSAGLLTSALPLRGFSAGALPANKHLIVVELFGGNDALNTLVPYRDPLYRHYRPTLALGKDELAPLTDELAFNRAWAGLADIFQRGELAVVQDVGYPSPNLSHFGSAAIWAQGTNSAVLESGWAGRVLRNRPRPEMRHDAHGIVLSGDEDLLLSPDIEVLALQDSRAFLNHALSPLPAVENYRHNPAALHILQELANTDTLNRRIRNKLRGNNRFMAWFTRDGYTEPQNAQAATLLWLIENGIRAPLYKISLSGFDLHANLRGAHERLLSKVETLLLGLRRGLSDIGVWQDSLIMVHSEFGRRPQENASSGTDHGTCGPVVLLGGGVGGGIWGERSSLEALDANGNPRFSTDFRAVYAAITDRFWQLPRTSASGQNITPLPIPL